jgi:hypothetical protein
MPRPARRHASPALLLSLLPACTIPPHEAHRTQDRAEPAAGLAELRCTTHNGAITVVGAPGATEVAIHARLSARGFTEQEAAANVDRLEVAVVRDGAVLTVSGRSPEDFDWRFSPAFSFTITLPQAMACKLTSHNGDLDLRAVDGAVVAATHNGAVTASTGAPRLQVESHNGEIDVELTGKGPVAGSVTTHNGSVSVAMGERAAKVEADTHNGSLQAERGFANMVVREDSLRFVAGDATGPDLLTVVTHNGSVRFR